MDNWLVGKRGYQPLSGVVILERYGVVRVGLRRQGVVGYRSTTGPLWRHAVRETGSYPGFRQMGKGRIVNRRGLLRGLGVIGVGTVVARVDLRFPGAVQGQAVSKIRVKSSGLPATVAGIRLVDSPIARRAVELSRESSPPYMFNHAIRTYLFGSLKIGRASCRERVLMPV